MTRSSSPDSDNAFGQLMLTVRSRLGLTQGQLATRLGISRQAVADWETRGKRPTANHLQDFINLAVQHKVFSGVQAVDDIKALWAAANQKVLLDEAWLSQLLASPPDPVSSPDTPPSTSHEPRLHWDDALAVDTFYGRDSELRTLNDWVVHHRCRVVTLLGLGGIGKSALAATLMHQLAHQFEIVIWRSLRDLPTCDALFIDLLRVLMPHALEEGNASVERRLTLLMEHLRAARILLVLDNVESVLEEGEITGRMKAGYEDFGRFLRQSAETQHQSTVLLTSRQKLHDLLTYEGNHAPVRSLRLAALNDAACEQLLVDRHVIGSPSERAHLIAAYTGNPLALKIVAQTIVDLFDGALKPFLDQGSVVFGGIHELLHQQYIRLSAEERRIVFWLAIMREPITFNQFQSLFVAPMPTAKVLETIDKLHRHSLIERGQAVGSFTLQSVVLEYLTDQLITEASAEIQRGDLTLLIQHGLEQAQVKDYVRETQTRLLIAPILAELQRGAVDLDVQLYTLLDRLRETSAEQQGYGPANLVALLRQRRGHLRGLHFSHLALRGVYLQGVEMQDARLTGAVMRDCDFTETFDSINSLTHSLNGQYWAASSEVGEVRLWDANGHTLVRLWSSSAGIIYRIALSPDGQTLAGGTWDGTLKVWDTATGALLWMMNWPQVVGGIYRLGYSPDGTLLMCVGSDTTVRLLRASDGVQVQMLAQARPVSMVAWNGDGSLLATGDIDGTIHLWSVSSLHTPEPAVCAHVMAAHTNGIAGLSFSPDGRVLVSGSRDGSGKFWDTTNGQFIKPLVVNANYSLNTSWSPDGRIIAVCGDGRVIWLWDVETEDFRLALQGHTAEVRKMFFSPDSQQIVSASSDGTIRIWDVSTGKCVRVIKGYTAAISAFDWSPDGQQVVSGSTDHVVTIYALNERVAPRLLYGHTRLVYSVSWSADGRWLASADVFNVVRIWDAKSGECTHILRNSDNTGNAFYNLSWSPDRPRLAIGTGEYGIVIWEFGAKQIDYRPFSASVGGRISWSPDGTQIAAAGQDHLVYLWNAEGHPVRQMVGHSTQVTSIDWSPSGEQLLSVGTHEIIVWDVQRGEQIAQITTSSAILSAGEWGATEQVVITGNSDGQLCWWDVRTRECVLTRNAHQGLVQAICKNADHTKLASCGDDGAIMIWEVDTGEHLQTVRRDRPYERLNITGVKGLTEAQLATLRQLGAIEELFA